MADLVAELAARAQALPPEDRARPAEQLLASLEQAPAEVEAAWDAEIRRRVEEIESGQVALIPAEEAFAEVRRALK